MLGNTFDHIQNVPDVIGAGVQGFDLGARKADFLRQLGHGLNGFFHHLTTVIGLLAGTTGLLRCVRGIAGDFLGRGAQLVDGRRHAVGAGALFIRADE